MARPTRGSGASLRTAGILLHHYDVNGPAFVERHWKATPLWHAIAFGRNLPLARFLLSRGSDPNHCLFAAAYNDDAAAIRLLAQSGASLDEFVDAAEDGLGELTRADHEAVDRAMPLWQSYAGLKRWIEKRA